MITVWRDHCRRSGARYALVLILFAASAADAQGTGPRIRAPEFSGISGWLNTSEPLRMADLRGQVVLLDFWTYCCINCLHVLPDLAYLAEQFTDAPFVIVGVHSAKFPQEKDATNVRKAVLRHNIRHPVAVDSDLQTWNAYVIRGWPTAVLIDPEGYIVATHFGEGHHDVLVRSIRQLLDLHRRKGTLGAPRRFRPEAAAFQPGVLQFPGKIAVDAARDRLVISDTNHHRVLVCNLAGVVQRILGDGTPGFRDGAATEARFHQPQGVALTPDGATLYVADTGNHALRAVDLATGRVVTIAGTGTQAREIQRRGLRPGSRTPLSSPWDVAIVGDRIFVAMAGPHQLWVYEPASGRIGPWAGTGNEGRRDGPNIQAHFAQPSGLATDGTLLYVADAEISSVRRVETRPRGRTTTVAGSGDLFGFGHRDGTGGTALFQHPKGVALHGETLYVADTFNHLIRTIDLRTGTVTTWLGTGRPERGTGTTIGLFEPGGLAVGGDTLYIADTNHHRILAVDLMTRAAREIAIELSHVDFAREN
ncbi:MAG: redoxin domain-containing protein [Phycisphaerales bacterium]|nr:redoxin domain-containing protein [Phycisphaerales bacterium]